mmetsp:Transcript_20151/g.20854  ORF Transcript_20151/g.20854 Transcript_20151/m.20854 type:complete len:263 (-) Transcript_20151:440-1228(-)
MGAFSSSAQILDIDHPSDKQKKTFLTNKPEIPLTRQVAHFTPSSFPLVPEVSKLTVSICRKSWESLLNKTYRNSFGIETAAITVFYNEFYRRLYMFDSSGAFDVILTKYSSKGGGNIAAKGAIIIRIMKFALTIENTQECKERLLKLGRAHYQMQIRPWQYAIFVEMLINTISNQLGILASHDVMSNWVHLFAFMLKYMLPTAINGLVSSSEVNVVMHNSSSLQQEETLEPEPHADQEAAVCTSNSHKSAMDALRMDHPEES